MPCQAWLRKCVQIADGLDFDLPSDVSDDEEIDEDMAFTEEEKRQFAGMFGDDGDASLSSDQADEDLLKEDASDVSEAAEFDADVRAFVYLSDLHNLDLLTPKGCRCL